MRNLFFFTLFAEHREHASMHPVAHEWLYASKALALSNLVLVMREDQVGSAAVNINLVAKGLARHRRALDVPAGPSLAPRTLPPRLAGFGSLPEGEVTWVMLALVRLDARSRKHRLGVAPREASIAREAWH